MEEMIGTRKTNLNSADTNGPRDQGLTLTINNLTHTIDIGVGLAVIVIRGNIKKFTKTGSTRKCISIKGANLTHQSLRRSMLNIPTLPVSRIV